MVAVRIPLIPAPQLRHQSRIIQIQERRKAPSPRARGSLLLACSPRALLTLSASEPWASTAHSLRAHPRAVWRAAWTGLPDPRLVFHLRLPDPPAATPRSRGLCRRTAGKRGAGNISYNTGFQAFLTAMRSYKKHYFRSRPRVRTTKSVMNKPRNSAQHAGHWHFPRCERPELDGLVNSWVLFEPSDRL